MRTTRVNRLWLTGLGSAGERTAAVGTAVTHDSTQPLVFVDCPAAGATILDEGSACLAGSATRAAEKTGKGPAGRQT